MRGLGYHITKKGYPRFSAGALRNQYVHRVIAAQKLGRELTKDEDAHHRDGDKLNFDPDNIEVKGHKEHGWISCLQHWYMNRKELYELAIIDSYTEEENAKSRLASIQD